MFLRKKGGKNSAGGDSDTEWNNLSDEVDKYASMADGGRDDESSSSGEEDADDEDSENEGRKDNEQIDLEIDREREEHDELIVDECEKSAEREDPDVDAEDLVLEPISVAERREACVLLSKVRNIILLQGPH